MHTIDPNLIPQNAILTPHLKEFEKLFNFKFQISNFKSNPNDQISRLPKPGTGGQAKIQNIVREKAKQYNCTILLKGPVDIVSDGEKTVQIPGGNAGMTKGGTGDVLAGLVAALYCKNEAFLSACSASFINKKAGESLFQKMGLYFNASDLADEIPVAMKKFID